MTTMLRFTLSRFTTPQRRNIHHTVSSLGRSIDNRSILIQPITHQIADHKSNTTTNIPKSATYTQLPDDSQFITQHYDELVKFKRYLKTTHNKSYKDYQHPNELIMDLSNFIESELKPGVWRFELPPELEVEFFLKFLHNLKICLKLNGGHTFILDVLLANKESFDAVEKNKKKRNKN